MPAVTSLRNPSLRWRHWEAVQNVMHKVFVRDENFTLGTLLEMNVSFIARYLCTELCSLCNVQKTSGSAL